MRTLVTHSLAYYLLAALVLAGLYVLSAWSSVGTMGYPLDDGWIHQTYARNLAQSGQLAFTPGVPSAGSTAPLWSFLLSLGHLGHLGTSALELAEEGVSSTGSADNLRGVWWSYGLGILCLGLTGWLTSRVSHQLFPNLWPHAVGMLCLTEWHLIWSAVSGMETILFIALSALLVERYLSHPDWSWQLGLLGGALILTRPEGIGLVGLIGLEMARRWWQTHQMESLKVFETLRVWKPLLIRWAQVTAGVVCLILPYVAFHYQLTNKPFPNTFYAKQAEYAMILETYPLWWRLFGNWWDSFQTVQGVFRVIFVGPQILLLPGLIWGAWLMVRGQRRDLWWLYLWWISFLVLYAVRLPVTYQHGRYQMPIMIWLMVLGWWGTQELISRIPPIRVRRMTRQLSQTTVLMLTLAFIVLGGNAYRNDVTFIEQNLVTPAQWLAENTAPDALLAAHDIGALGYFTQRSLLDLAGLVTPEVIPIIRDEAALFEFIQRRQADYVVIFPSWYPNLSRQPTLMPIYQTDTVDPVVVYSIERIER